MPRHDINLYVYARGISFNTVNFFLSGFVVFSVVVSVGVVDRLGGLVGVILGRTNMRLGVGATLFRSIRAP